MNRRGFLGALMSAPFVVRNSGVLMPVKEIIMPRFGVDLVVLRELLMPGLRQSLVKTQYNPTHMPSLISSFGGN
jgi:hypothetical protein